MNDKVISNPVSLSKDECTIIYRALSLYEKSQNRAANAPDQLPGAVDAFRKSVSSISSLRGRFLGLC